MTTFVYVIGRDEGPVKIGISTSPWTRLPALQTGCPFKLNLLKYFAMPGRSTALNYEREFHESYADYRLEGEWFDVDADVPIDWIYSKLEGRAAA